MRKALAESDDVFPHAEIFEGIGGVGAWEKLLSNVLRIMQCMSY